MPCDLSISDFSAWNCAVSRGALLTQIGQLLLQPGETLSTGGVLLFGKRLALHLALHDLTVELVDLGWLGIELDLEP